MEIVRISHPQTVTDALKCGEKIALFSLKPDGTPNLRLSDIILDETQNFAQSVPIVQPAIKYIQHNYNKEIRLSAMATLCDVSESYFSRLFSASTGKCLHDFVLNLRLKQACALLQTTRRTVVSIACDVGYVDCAYFNRLFKKKFGCTPLDYRRYYPFGFSLEK